MEVGDFAIFRGLPVIVHGIKGDDAEIRCCVEMLEDDDGFNDLLSECQSVVALKHLELLTESSAQELKERYTDRIKRAKAIIRGIDDCLRDMHEH